MTISNENNFNGLVVKGKRLSHASSTSDTSVKLIERHKHSLILPVPCDENNNNDNKQSESTAHLLFQNKKNYHRFMLNKNLWCISGHDKWIFFESSCC